MLPIALLVIACLLGQERARHSADLLAVVLAAAHDEARKEALPGHATGPLIIDIDAPCRAS